MFKKIFFIVLLTNIVNQNILQSFTDLCLNLYYNTRFKPFLEKVFSYC